MVSFKKVGLSVFGALTVTGTLIAAVLWARTLNATNVNAQNINATGTASFAQQATTGTSSFLGQARAQNLNVTSTLNVKTENTSSTAIGGGQVVDGLFRTVVAIDPDALPALSGSSTPVTVTGAVAGDNCWVNALFGDITGNTSTAGVACAITSSNTATVTFFNRAVTSTYNAASGTYAVTVQSFQ